MKAQCAGIRQNFETHVRRLFENQAVKGDHLDRIRIITLISSGLKLVDQFRELAIRFKGQNPTPPEGRAEQVGTALEVQHASGQAPERIEADRLPMDQWDSVRFESLRKRIATQGET